MKHAHRDSKTRERFISPSGKRYRLDYRLHRKTYYLGSFETVEEAVEVREAVAVELDGLPEAEQSLVMEELKISK